MLLTYDFVPTAPVLSDKQKQLGRPRDPEQTAVVLAFQKDPRIGPWTLGGLRSPDTVYIGCHAQNGHAVHFAVSKFILC